MLRKIIRIDEEKCNGCGDCVPSCAEGAIKIIDGKAKLIGESLCDGFGACLGVCPQGAITIEEREAQPFDEAAANIQHESGAAIPAENMSPGHLACPGSLTRSFEAKASGIQFQSGQPSESQLTNWPVQLKLVPPSAKYLEQANLLICADCVPFAVANFHERFLKGRTLMVGCPKLDDLQFYCEKLKLIFSSAKPQSIAVIRMEVPCCFGIVKAVEEARNEAYPGMPIDTITVSLKGEILDKSRL
jgi:NAD-dependent dihydropyrimidine dehydrogenase PreA subunit